MGYKRRNHYRPNQDMTRHFRLGSKATPRPIDQNVHNSTLYARATDQLWKKVARLKERREEVPEAYRSFYDTLVNDLALFAQRR